MGQWADAVYGCARELGLQDSVMTLDELSSGDEVRGTGSVSSCPAQQCNDSAGSRGYAGEAF